MPAGNSLFAPGCSHLNIILAHTHCICLSVFWQKQENEHGRALKLQTINLPQTHLNGCNESMPGLKTLTGQTCRHHVGNLENQCYRLPLLLSRLRTAQYLQSSSQAGATDGSNYGLWRLLNFFQHLLSFLRELSHFLRSLAGCNHAAVRQKGWSELEKHWENSNKMESASRSLLPFSHQAPVTDRQARAIQSHSLRLTDNAGRLLNSVG